MNSICQWLQKSRSACCNVGVSSDSDCKRSRSGCCNVGVSSHSDCKRSRSECCNIGVSSHSDCKRSRSECCNVGVSSHSDSKSRGMNVREWELYLSMTVKGQGQAAAVWEFHVSVTEEVKDRPQQSRCLHTLTAKSQRQVSWCTYSVTLQKSRSGCRCRNSTCHDGKSDYTNSTWNPPRKGRGKEITVYVNHLTLIAKVKKVCHAVSILTSQRLRVTLEKDKKKPYAFLRQLRRRRKKKKKKKKSEKSERLSVPIDGKQQWGLPSSVLPSLYSFHVLIGPVLGVRWPCQTSPCYLLRGWTFIDATPPYYLLHISWPILCHLEADALKFLTSNLSPHFVTPSYLWSGLADPCSHPVTIGYKSCPPRSAPPGSSETPVSDGNHTSPIPPFNYFLRDTSRSFLFHLDAEVIPDPGVNPPLPFYYLLHDTFWPFLDHLEAEELQTVVLTIPPPIVLLLICSDLFCPSVSWETPVPGVNHTSSHFITNCACSHLFCPVLLLIPCFDPFCPVLLLIPCFDPFCPILLLIACSHLFCPILLLIACSELFCPILLLIACSDLFCPILLLIACSDLFCSSVSWETPVPGVNNTPLPFYYLFHVLTFFVPFCYLLHALTFSVPSGSWETPVPGPAAGPCRRCPARSEPQGLLPE